MSILKFPSILILFLLISLILSAQNMVLRSGVSSDTERYEEYITLEVSPYNGQVLLGFMFTNVTGPLDASGFVNEPSFISITIAGTYSQDDNRTVIMVNLNTSEIVSISQGKLKADMLKAKVENFFDITLPFSQNFTLGDIMTYSYRIDECPIIQRFRDAFIQHKPSQGFSTIVNPNLINDYVYISFCLMRKGDSPQWTITASLNYPNYFSYGLGQEYIISLKGLTGYSGTIQSSPKSSKSTLDIGISQVDKDYKLISFDTTPSQMDKTQGTYGAVTSFIFEKIITGSSVDDLSIHFKIVSPNYIDPTTIAIYAGIVVVVVTLLGIIVFIIKKKR